MCRLRIPNGILTHWQLAGVADLAERYAGGYAHVTTRANLQMREVEPKNAVAMVEGIQDLGLCSRGSGADNIRNVTGTPTAGIDPQELIDTRPYAREWHFHILNDRSLYGIPRKFNVGFDGAGIIPVLEDTNDIGFQAVEVKDGFGVEPGVWFRLRLGGITGHKDFARETGVVVKPADATRVADAVVRVFIDHGDRTNRAKARLKYVLDAWGIDKFLAAMEEKLGQQARRACRPKRSRHARPSIAPAMSACMRRSRTGSTGSAWCCRSASSRPTRCAASPRSRAISAMARSASRSGRTSRSPAFPTSAIAAAEAAIEAIGLSTKATSIRAGLVACTGNVGCRLALADTKRHAEEIARVVRGAGALDTPSTSISPAARIPARSITSAISASLGARVQVSDEGDTVDGYHIHVGGGFGPDAAIGRELYRDVKAEDAPKIVERMLKSYLAIAPAMPRNVLRLHAPA